MFITIKNIIFYTNDVTCIKQNKEKHAAAPCITVMFSNGYCEVIRCDNETEAENIFYDVASMLKSKNNQFINFNTTVNKDIDIDKVTEELARRLSKNINAKSNM